MLENKTTAQGTLTYGCYLPVLTRFERLSSRWLIYYREGEAYKKEGPFQAPRFVLPLFLNRFKDRDAAHEWTENLRNDNRSVSLLILFKEGWEDTGSG